MNSEEISPEKWKKINEYEKFEYALSCLYKSKTALDAIKFSDLNQVVDDIISSIKEEMPDDPEDDLEGDENEE